MGQKVILRFR